MITNKRILITGATGQVARPIAEALAGKNEVWCLARFSEPGLKQQLEARGMKTHVWELGSSDFRGLPAKFDYVVHSAWAIYQVANDFEAAFKTNVEGTGLLMDYCRAAEAFLFVSGLVAYRARPSGKHIYKEGDEAYGNDSPYAPSYGASKIAGEGVVRAFSRVLSLPATVARLGLAYGTYGHGGRPTRVFRKLLAGEPIYIKSQRHLASLIHEDDLAANVEPLLKAAAVPATIVNWVSDDIADEIEVYEYIGRIAGIAPTFIVDDAKAVPVMAGDPSLRRSITGPSKIDWKAGILKSLRARFPEHEFRETA